MTCFHCGKEFPNDAQVYSQCGKSPDDALSLSRYLGEQDESRYLHGSLGLAIYLLTIQEKIYRERNELNLLVLCLDSQVLIFADVDSSPEGARHEHGST